MAGKKVIRTLECYECHTKIMADLDTAFEMMRTHVRVHHNREIAFTKETYANMKNGARMISDQLLYDLMLTC